MVYHQTNSQASPLHCPTMTSKEHHPRHKLSDLWAFGSYSHTNIVRINMKTRIDIPVLLINIYHGKLGLSPCVTGIDWTLKGPIQTSPWHRWCHLIVLCNRSYFAMSVVSAIRGNNPCAIRIGHFVSLSAREILLRGSPDTGKAEMDRESCRLRKCSRVEFPQNDENKFLLSCSMLKSFWKWLRFRFRTLSTVAQSWPPAHCLDWVNGVMCLWCRWEMSLQAVISVCYRLLQQWEFKIFPVRALLSPRPLPACLLFAVSCFIVLRKPVSRPHPRTEFLHKNVLGEAQI